ncbi:MAG: methylglyoxal synthase [Chloroflexi bacterium]|nr:methylglyoxal synthase [Chloroflexota bacterium]
MRYTWSGANRCAIVPDWRRGVTVKTIALIAHDGKKDEMLEFVREHLDLLKKYHIIATGTTGGLIHDQTGLEVERVLSGPIGGDVQIAARVVTGEVAAVIFFIDSLERHPHDPDIQTLQRLCVVHDVPLATNPSTARLILLGSEPD